MLYVGFIFFVGSALMIALGVFSRSERSTPSSEDEATSNEQSRPRSYVDFLPVVPLSIALVLLTTATVYAHFFDVKPVSLAMPLEAFPKKINGYHLDASSPAEWPLPALEPDEKLARIYKDRDGNEFGLYIAYFASQDQEHELVNHLVDRIHEQKRTRSFRFGASVVELNAVDQLSEDDARPAYFWYDIDGRILSSPYGVKLVSAIQGMLEWTTNGAMVLVVLEDGQPTSANTEPAALRFLDASFPIVHDYLKAESGHADDD